jgi:hypothetical protein
MLDVMSQALHVAVNVMYGLAVAAVDVAVGLGSVMCF